MEGTDLSEAPEMKVGMPHLALSLLIALVIAALSDIIYLTLYMWSR